ncbi:MAG TPA: YgiT-type zinc finger protein [Thermoanaerobaculia bacterium]|jgi:YgiT-type zinc finger domain-containing protein|nr:YgiT-type zinc finger protein [Thermoanaerobaculia bacterium]
MPTNVAQRILSAITSLAPSSSRPTPLRVVPPAPPPAVDLDATLPIGQGSHPSSGPETLPMRCLRCQGSVEKGTAPVRVERNGYKLSWTQVPAWVCKRCELAYFEPGEVEAIRRALSDLRALSQV